MSNSLIQFTQFDELEKPVGNLSSVESIVRKKRTCSYDGPFNKNASVQEPEYVCFESDGRYLLLHQPSNMLFGLEILWKLLVIVGGLLLTLALLLVIYYSNKFDFLYLWVSSAISFIIAFLIYIVSRDKVLNNNVVIFDRESGNVYFPASGSELAMVIPFTQVEAYGCWKDYPKYLNYFVQSHYEIYMTSTSIPNSQASLKQKFNRNQTISVLGIIYDQDTATQYWSFIAHFMSKNEPLSHNDYFQLGIAWYKETKMSLPVLLAKPIWTYNLTLKGYVLPDGSFTYSLHYFKYRASISERVERVENEINNPDLYQIMS